MAQRTPAIRFAVITQAAAGTQTPVAAVAGKKIVVVNYCFTLSAAGTLKFQSAANDISGAMDCAIAGGVVNGVGDQESPLMETNPGEALNLVSTGGAAKGHLAYYLSDT